MNDIAPKSESGLTALVDNATARDAVLVAGGLALVVFGTGLLMTHPGLRKLMTMGLTRVMPDLQEPLKQGLSGLLPDVERYMKLRAM